MIEKIGVTAGQIYEFLVANNNESTLSKIKKAVDSKEIEMALGWLAREDKIEMFKKGLSMNVKLK